MNTSTVIVRALLVAALVCVASAAHPNFHMKFHQDSLVNGQSLPLPHGVTFPTKIQLVDSAGAADLTSSGLIITASVAAPASLTGNVAVVKNGVADFSHLAFATCGGMPSAITFTADTRSTLAVAGKSLVSGQISVQPVRNAEVLFDSTSFLKAGAAATAVSGVSMGAIKINLLDSCGNKDASNTGFTVVASTNNGTLLGETAATFTNGVAIFTGLSFADAPTNARLTFTVLTNGAGAAEGKKLVTGVVAVHAQALPSVGIRFKKSHSAFVTVGSGAAVALNAHFTPSAVVEVVDSADRVDATGALTVTITSSDASVGMVGTSAVAVNGVADFSSFKFTGCPAAPVRLTFTAGSEGNTAAAGKAIVTGLVRVVCPETESTSAARPFLVLSSSQFCAVAFCVALVVCCALFYGCAKRETVKYVEVACTESPTSKSVV